MERKWKCIFLDRLEVSCFEPVFKSFTVLKYANIENLYSNYIILYYYAHFSRTTKVFLFFWTLLIHTHTDIYVYLCILMQKYLKAFQYRNMKIFVRIKWREHQVRWPEPKDTKRQNSTQHAACSRSPALLLSRSPALRSLSLFFCQSHAHSWAAVAPAPSPRQCTQQHSCQLGAHK